jgi:membrane-bound acyltransferase YfiQ involved in biofilm formation
MLDILFVEHMVLLIFLTRYLHKISQVGIITYCCIIFLAYSNKPNTPLPY